MMMMMNDDDDNAIIVHNITEELTALKQASLDSFNLWTAVGKPRFGSEFLAMKRAKFAYKLMAIKNKECSITLALKFAEF